ncbi:MAG: hypothetical protein ABIL68_01485 [bacterium]
MHILMIIISLIYYALVAYTAGLLITNMIKTKAWDKELLYIIVLIPFLLRLFRLK